MLDFKDFGLTITDDNNINILGIDLGHGETSAALCKGGIKIPTNLTFSPLNSVFKIVSALYIANDGSCAIGANAMGRSITEGKLYTCFKDKPSMLYQNFENDTITKKTLVQRFFGEVIKCLYLCNEEQLRDGKTIVFVGRPSSSEWAANSGDRVYASILEEGIRLYAKKNLKVIVMPESRASLIKVFKDQNNRSQNNPQKGIISTVGGVIVFDAGSSTMDCTYTNYDQELNMDFGEPLGASYIENSMLTMFCEKHGINKSQINDIQNAKIDLRLAKEIFYSFPNRKNRVTIDYGEDTGIMNINDPSLMKKIIEISPVVYTTSEMGLISGTWYSLCKDFFMKAKHKIISTKKPLSTIILTGGASRMNFLRELCQETFSDIKNINIIEDVEPSLCVSRGLVYAGTTDIEATKAYKKVTEEIKKSMKDKYQNLIDDLAKKIAEEVYPIGLKHLEEWKEPEGENVVLKKVLDNMQAEIILTIRKKQTVLIEQVYEKWLNQIRTDIINEVNRGFQTLYPDMVTQTAFFNFTNKRWIEIQNEINNKAKINVTITAMVTTIDFTNIVGAITAIIFVILLIPLLFLGKFGEKIADHLENMYNSINERDLNSCYTSRKRNKMYQFYSKNKETTIDKLCLDIKKSLATEEMRKTKELTCNMISEAIDIDIKKATDTVCLYYA